MEFVLTETLLEGSSNSVSVRINARRHIFSIYSGEFFPMCLELLITLTRPQTLASCKCVNLPFSRVFIVEFFNPLFPHNQNQDDDVQPSRNW